MKHKVDELKQSFSGINEEARSHFSFISKLIDHCAMDPDEVGAMIDSRMNADLVYPELANVEGMTSDEFAALYKKMKEDVKASPEKFEAHMKFSGLSEDELAGMFGQISEGIEKYPEIWESKDAAQLLGPKNLAIFVHAFKK